MQNANVGGELHTYSSRILKNGHVQLGTKHTFFDPEPSLGPQRMSFTAGFWSKLYSKGMFSLPSSSVIQTVVMLGLSMVSVPSDSSSVKHSPGSLVESSVMSIVMHSVESVLENVSVPLAAVKSSVAKKENRPLSSTSMRKNISHTI